MSDCVKRCLLSALFSAALVCICGRPAIAAKNPWLNCGTLGDITSRGVNIPAERLTHRLYRNAFGLVVVWVPVRPLTSEETFAFRGVGNVNIDPLLRRSPQLKRQTSSLVVRSERVTARDCDSAVANIGLRGRRRWDSGGGVIT